MNYRYIGGQIPAIVETEEAHELELPEELDMYLCTNFIIEGCEKQDPTDFIPDCILDMTYDVGFDVGYLTVDILKFLGVTEDIRIAE